MDKEAQEGIDRDLEILGLFGCPFYSRNCGERRQLFQLPTQFPGCMQDPESGDVGLNGR